MQTIRQQIVTLLTESEMSAPEIGAALQIKEKEVCEHLGHIFRSLSAAGKKVQMRPSSCRKCGYVFTGRKRLTRPSRCPRCKSTYLQQPFFRIIAR